MPNKPALSARLKEQIASAPALKALFENDPERFKAFSFEHGALFADISKTHIEPETLTTLCDYLDSCGFNEKRTQLFEGGILNESEGRKACHTQLRGPDNVLESHDALAAMAGFTQALYKGELKGLSGKPIDTIVNLGIGGSDIGPRVACSALTPYKNAKAPRILFLSNPDPNAFKDIVADNCDPETTLFLISSKGFGTRETMINAHRAYEWLGGALRDTNGAAYDRASIVNHHMRGITGNQNAARAFGFETDNIFNISDDIGGRFSLCSAIGLSLMISIGVEHFTALLKGAHDMDQHFAQAPPQENLPALLALVGFAYHRFVKLSGHIVLPYAHHLRHLPLYVQQLCMESNGKDNKLSPLVFGTEGAHAQHAYMQAAHQGALQALVEYIGVCDGDAEQLKAMFAQSKALMDGLSDKGAPYKDCPGNRPSVTLLLKDLSPHSVGQLIAFYEHRIFTEGLLYGVNSFDQWGVELGKTLTAKLDEPEPCGTTGQWDASTSGLLNKVTTHKTAKTNS